MLPESVSLGEELAVVAAVTPDQFERFCQSIDPAWVEEALLATGTATIRRRRLPAQQVIWMVLRSHLIVAASFGPYAAAELSYAEDLWPLIPDHSLTVVDRGFFAAHVLIPLGRDGTNRHWLTRAKKNQKWRTVERLGVGDELVEMTVSREARRKDPTLPQSWRLLAI